MFLKLTTLDNIIRKLNSAAGGTAKLKVVSSDLTPHLFRHNYATELYYSGIDVKTAQYLLGHANLNMTLEVYTHLDTERVKDAAKQINSHFSSSQ